MARVHSVRGEPTYIMIGTRNNVYYLVKVCRLPNRLAIYESKFAGPNGTQGVIGGTSKVVTEMLQNLYAGSSSQLTTFKLESYLYQQLRTYKEGYNIDLSI